jgi:universal stress protein family protein
MTALGRAGRPRRTPVRATGHARDAFRLTRRGWLAGPVRWLDGADGSPPRPPLPAAIRPRACRQRQVAPTGRGKPGADSLDHAGVGLVAACSARSSVVGPVGVAALSTAPGQSARELPAMILRRPASPVARVVVGADDSAGSVAALHWAAAEARRCQALLRTVSAWEEPGQPAPSQSGHPVQIAARRVQKALARVLSRQHYPRRIRARTGSRAVSTLRTGAVSRSARPVTSCSRSRRRRLRGHRHGLVHR